MESDSTLLSARWHRPSSGQHVTCHPGTCHVAFERTLPKHTTPHTTTRPLVTTFPGFLIKGTHASTATPHTVIHSYCNRFYWQNSSSTQNEKLWPPLIYQLGGKKTFYLWELIVFEVSGDRDEFLIEAQLQTQRPDVHVQHDSLQLHTNKHLIYKRVLSIEINVLSVAPFYHSPKYQALWLIQKELCWIKDFHGRISNCNYFLFSIPLKWSAVAIAFTPSSSSHRTPRSLVFVIVAWINSPTLCATNFDLTPGEWKKRRFCVCIFVMSKVFPTL